MIAYGINGAGCKLFQALANALGMEITQGWFKAKFWLDSSGLHCSAMPSYFRGDPQPELVSFHHPMNDQIKAAFQEALPDLVEADKGLFQTLSVEFEVDLPILVTASVHVTEKGAEEMLKDLQQHFNVLGTQYAPEV